MLHPTLDRSSKTPYNITKSAMFINTFLETYTFSDPWRFLYPNLKQFSFFAPVHRSYSRIDYLLIDDKLLTSVTDCTYESIVISDHSPVVLKLVFPKSPVRKTWRFNNFILSDSSFVDLINKRIDFFLSINDTSDVSKATLWESLKAYIRGEIISFSSWERKKRNHQLNDLINKIKQLELKCASKPTPEFFMERTMIQTEIDLVTSEQTERLLLQSRSKLYEHLDKSGKILAQQIRQYLTANTIPSIRRDDGRITKAESEINSVFEQFSSSSLWLSTEVVTFSPRPHPYLPCFAPLSRERLSLHCSPN